MVAEERGIPGAVRGMAFAIALIVRSVEGTFMHKVKQHKGVAVAAAVCAVAMAASLATHAGAAGDRRY